MTDWKKAAESQAIPLAAAELETVVARLGALEQKLSALAAKLPPEAEPATIFPVQEPSR